jgi:hypothetical protein
MDHKFVPTHLYPSFRWHCTPKTPCSAGAHLAVGGQSSNQLYPSSVVPVKRGFCQTRSSLRSVQQSFLAEACLLMISHIRQRRPPECSAA